MSIPANGSPGLWCYISPLKAYPVLPVLQAINVEGQQPIHPGVIVETIQMSWDTPFFAATQAHREPISRGSQLHCKGKLEGTLEVLELLFHNDGAQQRVFTLGMAEEQVENMEAPSTYITEMIAAFDRHCQGAQHVLLATCESVKIQVTVRHEIENKSITDIQWTGCEAEIIGSEEAQTWVPTCNTEWDLFPYLRPPFDNSSFDSTVIPDPEEEEYQRKLDRYHRAYLGKHHELRQILNTILQPPLGQVSDHKEHLSSIEMQVPNNSQDEPPLYKALSGSAVLSALSVKNNSFMLDVYKLGYAHMDAPIDPSITQLAKLDHQH
ncbi:hypothetical protein C8J57DRAFT_1215963 [Mycena rebaudengoi]|nr:hypothetical protein C8J57DRAFT_1215963 [Mycena rebaudengoi]